MILNFTDADCGNTLSDISLTSVRSDFVLAGASAAACQTACFNQDGCVAWTLDAGGACTGRSRGAIEEAMAAGAVSGYIANCLGELFVVFVCFGHRV